MIDNVESATELSQVEKIGKAVSDGLNVALTDGQGYLEADTIAVMIEGISEAVGVKLTGDQSRAAAVDGLRRLMGGDRFTNVDPDLRPPKGTYPVLKVEDVGRTRLAR